MIAVTVHWPACKSCKSCTAVMQQTESWTLVTVAEVCYGYLPVSSL